MKNNINKKTKVSHRNGEIWNIKIGFFNQRILLAPDIPLECLNVKFKVVLN